MKEHSCVPVKSYLLKNKGYLKYQISPLAWGKTDKFRDSQEKGGTKELQMGGVGESLLNVHSVSGVEKVPEMDSDDGCIALQMYF